MKARKTIRCRVDGCTKQRRPFYLTCEGHKAQEDAARDAARRAAVNLDRAKGYPR